jgi:hypothetical protein
MRRLLISPWVLHWSWWPGISRLLFRCLQWKVRHTTRPQCGYWPAVSHVNDKDYWSVTHAVQFKLPRSLCVCKKLPYLQAAQIPVWELNSLAAAFNWGCLYWITNTNYVLWRKPK